MPQGAGGDSERAREASRSGLEQVERRLVQLYEISKLLASFENAERTVDTALAIAALSLPLRSVILIDTEDGNAKMIVWPSEGRSAAQMRAVAGHAVTAYRDLIGAAPTEALHLGEQAGLTALPRQAETNGSPPEQLMVIPLVGTKRPPFGALQLEVAQPLDEGDVMFVGAIARLLAVALDRDRTWRRDLTRREDAEEGRIDAEARGATAERDLLRA